MKNRLHTRLDFFKPIESGKDFEPLYAKLSASQQPTFIRVLEASIKTSTSRRDLYKAPLEIYAGLALKDESVRARALAVLGSQAENAKSRHLGPVYRDLCTTLVSLSEAAHNTSNADPWRSELSAAL